MTPTQETHCQACTTNENTQNKDRDTRDPDYSEAPPTPPGMRDRTERFKMLRTTDPTFPSIPRHRPALQLSVHCCHRLQIHQRHHARLDYKLNQFRISARKFRDRRKDVL